MKKITQKAKKKRTLWLLTDQKGRMRPRAVWDGRGRLCNVEIPCFSRKRDAQYHGQEKRDNLKPWLVTKFTGILHLP